MWNRILLMRHCRVALVNIWAVTSVLLRVHSHFLAEVLLFRPEIINCLAHVCIHIVEGKHGGGPIGCLFMDPAVAIRHVLPDSWHHTAKPCKDEKFNIYDTELALERVKYFSAQGYILTIAVALCVTSLVIIIQVISWSNILIIVVLLGGRVQVVIPIFSIVLLWWRKQARIVEIVYILLNRESSLVDIILYLVRGGLVRIGKSQRNKCQKHGVKDNIQLPPIEVSIYIGVGPE